MTQTAVVDAKPYSETSTKLVSVYALFILKSKWHSSNNMCQLAAGPLSKLDIPQLSTKFPSSIGETVN